jgi:hypothetical protein
MQTAAPVSPGPFFTGTIDLKASGMKLQATSPAGRLANEIMNTSENSGKVFGPNQFRRD